MLDVKRNCQSRLPLFAVFKRGSQQETTHSLNCLVYNLLVRKRLMCLGIDKGNKTIKLATNRLKFDNSSRYAKPSCIWEALVRLSLLVLGHRIVAEDWKVSKKRPSKATDPLLRGHHNSHSNRKLWLNRKSGWSFEAAGVSNSSMAISEPKQLDGAQMIRSPSAMYLLSTFFRVASCRGNS